jgi:hypothetical protein
VEQFVTLERAIACPHASVAVAADTAAQVLTSAGYRRGLGFGPTQSYVRAYRPMWATVLAFVLAVPTVGLGLLLLLVKAKDHCNVVIEDGPYGVVALVSGRVPASLPAHLEAASGGNYPDPGYPQQPQQPSHMLLSPSQGGGYEAGPQQSSILRPAFPPHGSQGSQAPQGSPPPHAPAEPPPFPYPSGRPQSRPEPQRPQQQPQAQPEPARNDQQPAPVAVRPPSKLAPPPPPDSPGNRPNAGRPPAPVNGAGAPNGAAANGANGSNGRQPDDDPFSSTSGRVPWAVAGARPPAPAGPPPVSPGAWSPNAPVPPANGAPVAAGSGSGSRPGGGASRPNGDGAKPQPGSVATAVGESGYVLRVDSGEALELGPFCLLGREPVARDGDPPAVFVRFDDVKLSVSKTHIAYGVDERGFWVMDRNSTNGTTIIDPSGHRTPCAPGARHYVPFGSQVQIGQRRLTVERPDGASG